MKRWVAAVLLLTVAGALATAQEVQTLKERLSDKASDNQRVDNCHVPAERRGGAPRPDCPEDPRPSPPSAAAAASVAPR
jgi:hypothetical protein